MDGLASVAFVTKKTIQQNLVLMVLVRVREFSQAGATREMRIAANPASDAQRKGRLSWAREKTKSGTSSIVPPCFL